MLTKTEIEVQAKRRFGVDAAHVFSFGHVDRGLREQWHGVSIDGVIIGCRRELSDLPELIQRGRMYG